MAKKKIRLIARLDVKDTNLVKGIQLEGLRKLGDPNLFAREYYEQGIDELLYIDIVASLYNRNNLSDIVRKTVDDVYIPVCVGGGLRSVEDVRHILSMGADKVAINTAAIKRPELITEVANAFGSQCMVLSIQAKRNRTIAYFACVLLVSCLLAGIGWLLVNDVCSLNKAPVEVEITVEEGDSRGDVAKKLHDAGLVNSRLVFNIAGTFLHYNRYVEPGTYKLNSDMDFRALITNMHDWETDAKEAQGLIKVTIPEGYTVREIIDLLAEKGVATKEDLEDACANFAYEDYDFLDDDKLGSIDRMEGFLFPSTYEFDKNRSAVYAVETMLVYFKNSISQQMLADIKASPYSLQEIITMASLIEKESIGDDTERKNISSVIHNRLENPDSNKGGRALQLCSTINYIMKHDGVKTFDTEIDSPYNTYINPGLTPGPICNPGLSAIEAAIYPADTDYYFFALGKDGKSHFFTDYNEHLKFINSGEYQPIYS